MPAPLHCDVLVIGSGAAGLATAVTAAHHGLRVVVAEKHGLLGGTSAWSGGWLWIPGNPLAIAEGQIESPGAVEQYLCQQLQRTSLSRQQLAYLRAGPQMVAFFSQHTAVQFQSGSRMPDMHAGPGSRQGGRSVCALPYDGRRLGPWIERLRGPLDIVSLAGMGIAGGNDLASFYNATRSLSAARHVAGRLLRHTRDRLVHGRGLQLVNGNALMARLLRSALDLEVSFMTDSPAQALLQEQGRVCGARLGGPHGSVEVRARRGVVLACGGFAHDAQRIAGLIGHRHFSAAPVQNSGDGLRLGEAVGAFVDDGLPSAAAWAPVSLVPRRDGSTGHFPHLIDRAKPGFIAVLDNGRRFTNEADCYHDFMNDLLRATPPGQAPHAWLICDQRARRRYGIGWAKPFPFPAAWYEHRGYLFTARTPAELAARCGIDGAQLQATLQRFNDFAARGIDPDFGRGESSYNRAQGEPLHAPNPSLRALDQGPLHAVKLLPGSLGTFAGLRCDEHARALDATGQPIAGLFAVGNDMNSIMEGHYPSGGITLGPGMTFGYLAGLALADRETDRTPCPNATGEVTPISAAGNATRHH